MSVKMVFLSELRLLNGFLVFFWVGCVCKGVSVCVVVFVFFKDILVLVAIIVIFFIRFLERERVFLWDARNFFIFLKVVICFLKYLCFIFDVLFL